MTEYRGKVALVTGAASGIGLAIATRAAAEGMTVVMADIDGERLAAAAADLRAGGHQVVTEVVDVSSRDSVAALEASVRANVGDVWLLVNNAGVFTPSGVLETSITEWEFVLGINLWGVVYMLDAFLPGIAERNDGYVVNNSSICGVLTTPHAASYVASKHAVVALTESLYRNFDRSGSNVGVTVLCPGAVPTNILRSIEHWPARLGDKPDIEGVDYPEIEGMLSPEATAAKLFDAIAARRFWCLPDTDGYAPSIAARAEDIITGRNPHPESGDQRVG